MLLNKGQRNQILEMTITSVGREILIHTTPTDWAKTGIAKNPDTLPYTIQLPKKYAERLAEMPFSDSAFQLFFCEAIVSKVADVAEKIEKEGFTKNLNALVKDIIDTVPETFEIPTADLTKELMKKVTVQ